MQRLDDNTLAELAQEESDRVERKGTFTGKAPEAVRQAVCAFSNDLPGHGAPGVVLVGLNDDGSPSGLPITDQLLRQLADIKTDGNILPLPTMTVERRIVNGVELAVLACAPSDSPPVRFKGRIWVRVGPRRAVATAQDERILNERRRHGARPWDVRPVGGARARDLDIDRFESEYLTASIAPDVLDANDRTQEERLAATKMVASADDPTPTGLGLLVIGRDPSSWVPGAYIQFLRIEGVDLGVGAIKDQAAISGTIGDQIAALESKMSAHNETRMDYAKSPQAIQTPLFPFVALQQLVRNALLHRSYEDTNSPVRVTWYTDRIEIWSSGGPFGSVTQQTFGQPNATDYRNPNLAEALKALGFVQKFGSGIALVKASLAQNGNPDVEFDVAYSHVLATVRPKP